MNNTEIKEMTDNNLMPTYGHFNIALKSGNNATLKDFSNKEYIDFTSGIGVISLGHGNEKWIKSVQNQVNKIAHTSNLFYNEPVALLSKAICEKSGYDRVFFCNSGAEANECAIKLARKYSFDKYGAGRHNIITLTNSFHGRTMATISATAQDSMHNYFFPFNKGFIYIDNFDLKELEKHIKSGTVCAVMFEFIQGEGGVIPLPKDFLQSLKKLCKSNDVLLIGDEVQTGVGRTGTFYAYEQFGVKPDILTSAKGLGNGLPIGACLCADFLSDTLSVGTHGSTFGGNPISCSAALTVVESIDTTLLGEIKEKSDYIFSKLNEMPQVKSVRGLGLMIGIELKSQDAKELAKKCVENGLLILTAKKLLRMLPPLTISYEEIDKGLDILKNTLKQGESI